jgi:hypothetical protein
LDVRGGHLFRWVDDTTAPQTGAVSLFPRLGQVNSAPVTIQWSGSDDTSSPWQLRFLVEIRTKFKSGWGSWRRLTSSAEGTTFDSSIALGKFHQARVRTRDAAGNLSPWALSNTLKPWTRQETAFTRSGSWTSASDPQAMGDRVIRSRNFNSNARLSFIGRGVGAVMATGFPLGTARVCVDRGRTTEVCALVDLTTLGSGSRRIVALFSGLPLGTHTLDVNVRSELVILDGAIVWQ